MSQKLGQKSEQNKQQRTDNTRGHEIGTRAEGKNMIRSGIAGLTGIKWMWDTIYGHATLIFTMIVIIK